MTQVVPTLTIEVDEHTKLRVDDTSREVQELISLFDEWRQDEADQTVQLLKTRAALRDIQQNIGLQLQKDQKEAAEKAEADLTTANASDKDAIIEVTE